MRTTDRDRVQALRDKLTDVETGFDPNVGEDLPLFVRPLEGALSTYEEALAWFIAHRPVIDEISTVVGGVVLRGFPIHSAGDFSQLAAQYPEPEFGYAGGATPRKGIEGRAYEATQLPPEGYLHLHQEMSYLPRWPARLAFFSMVPAETGGATIIGDMRRFTELVQGPFFDTVRDKGIRYVRNFRSPEWSTGNATADKYHRPWTEAFDTTDPATAERDITAMGMQFEWEGESLTVTNVSPGIITHPDTGDELWFNQLAGMAETVESIGPERMEVNAQVYADRPRPLHCEYGDGSPIDSGDIVALYPKLREVTVGFPWQHGDVMVIDNLNTAHGREPYTGRRDTQVALLG
jgi:hypothetical protein